MRSYDAQETGVDSQPTGGEERGPLIVGPSVEQLPEVPVPTGGESVDGIVRAAQFLVEHLRQREQELARLSRITERINYGVMLEEILEYLYREVHQVIPCNRIGFSLVDEPRGMVVAHWSHSDRRRRLREGFEAPLAGSSLSDVLRTARPRIINDLVGYLHGKPESASTRLIVAEGMRSSLTCPLIVQGRPIGFLFFSSDQVATYSSGHVGLFQQIAGHLSSIVEKGRLYTELSKQKAIIEKQNRLLTEEMEMARHVQRAMIPRAVSRIPGLEIAFDYEPVIQVGGDVLDVVPVQGGRALLFIGDAMGHGVQAALVMPVLKTALQAAAEADPSPDRVLAAINRVLCTMLEEYFATGACCLVDPATGDVDIALAGHPPPYVHSVSAGTVEPRGVGGLLFGVNPDVQYPSTRIHLAVGDTLVLYTDGVVEAMDADRRMYGTDRLAEQIRRHAQAPPDQLVGAVIDSVKSHRGPQPLADDLALLVARRT